MIGRRRDRALERRLRALRAPHESQTQQRAWPVIATVYGDRAVRRRRRSWIRVGLVPALVLTAGVLALTPAGATVHRWIVQTIVAHARPQLVSLPASGRILVAGPGGAWTVAADGSRHRVGPGPEAAWSPHGLYVAVAGAGELSALTPTGTTVWSVVRPDVHDPRWFGPNGYRVAYLSADTLRVIAGDGTGDRALARDVGSAAPAWRPAHAYALAYVQRPRTVVVRDADTGQVAWSRRLASVPTLLSWSADGSRLLVLTATDAVMFDASGRGVRDLPARNGSLSAGALSPDGTQLALLDGRAVTITALTRPDSSPRVVLTAPGARQLAWSPDHRWVLVSWPPADEWVFVHATGVPRVIAMSRIAEQFGARRPRPAFPSLEGWCCAPGSGSG
jgi:outer membrane protein assembly factor BamB